VTLGAVGVAVAGRDVAAAVAAPLCVAALLGCRRLAARAREDVRSADATAGVPVPADLAERVVRSGRLLATAPKSAVGPYPPPEPEAAAPSPVPPSPVAPAPAVPASVTPAGATPSHATPPGDAPDEPTRCWKCRIAPADPAAEERVRLTYAHLHINVLIARYRQWSKTEVRLPRCRKCRRLDRITAIGGGVLLGIPAALGVLILVVDLVLVILQSDSASWGAVLVGTLLCAPVPLAALCERQFRRLSGRPSRRTAASYPPVADLLRQGWRIGG
jgi:hypothetical protein